MPRPPRPAGPAPDRSALREAAIRHLARFSATEAGLVRVLERRLQRWARAAAAEGQTVDRAAADGRLLAREVARALAEAGAVDDAAFATARASRLLRSGRSRRVVAAHLAAKGVSADLAGSVLPADADELPAALAFARRRRIGPFRPEADDTARMKDLAALARAGFSRDVAERALQMAAADAEALVLALKRG